MGPATAIANPKAVSAYTSVRSVRFSPRPGLLVALIAAMAEVARRALTGYASAPCPHGAATPASVELAWSWFDMLARASFTLASFTLASFTLASFALV
jgi:hypothetical protein